MDDIYYGPSPTLSYWSKIWVVYTVYSIGTLYSIGYSNCKLIQWRLCCMSVLLYSINYSWFILGPISLENMILFYQLKFNIIFSQNMCWNHSTIAVFNRNIRLRSSRYGCFIPKYPFRATSFGLNYPFGLNSPKKALQG